jgi:hypothetical protein
LHFYAKRQLFYKNQFSDGHLAGEAIEYIIRKTFCINICCQMNPETRDAHVRKNVSNLNTWSKDYRSCSKPLHICCLMFLKQTSENLQKMNIPNSI